MKFYFLFHLILPSLNTKSQGAKNDSVFEKMKEFVRTLIFSITSGRARSIFHSDFSWKGKKRDIKELDQ